MLRYSILAAFIALLATPVAQAAQVKMMASGAMAHALQEIGDDFAKKNGHSIEYAVSTTGVLQDRLRKGEKADIIEVTSVGMDALEKEKLVDPSTRVEMSGTRAPSRTATPSVGRIRSRSGRKKPHAMAVWSS